jgi:hypothetical protein
LVSIVLARPPRPDLDPDAAHRSLHAVRRAALGAAVWAVAAVPPLLYLVATTVAAMAEQRPVDWLTYVHGSSSIIAGTSPYAAYQLEGPYPLPIAAGGNGYVYPPSAAVLTAPFLHPLELWIGLNVGVHVLGTLAILWRHALIRPLPVGVALWLTVLWPGLGNGVAAGAVSPLLAGALGLIYAGIPLAGLAAALKIFPASWIVLTRDRLVVSFVGLAAPIVLSTLLAGPGPWIEYVTAMRNAVTSCVEPHGAWTCVGIPTWLLYVTGAWLFVASLRAPRPVALLLLGALPVIVAPQVWDHYLLTLVPGVVACLAWLGGAALRRARRNQVRLNAAR